MNFILPLTIILFLLSFLKDREKSLKALIIAWKKFSKIFPAFIMMIIITSISLALLPEEVITKALDNENKFISLLLASSIGSVTMMPGFITFPLAGVLLKKGVTYMVLSAFTTTLMMVGVLTYPLEKAYFGAKVTIIRNLAGLVIALTISIVTGLFYGELL